MFSSFTTKINGNLKERQIGNRIHVSTRAPVSWAKITVADFGGTGVSDCAVGNTARDTSGSNPSRSTRKSARAAAVSPLVKSDDRCDPRRRLRRAVDAEPQGTVARLRVRPDRRRSALQPLPDPRFSLRCRGDPRRCFEKAKRRSRLAWVASLAFLVLAGVAAYLAYVARQEAQRANEQANFAEKQKAAALNNETHALAALSRAAAREGRPLDGVELALAAWPRGVGILERPMLGDAIRYLSLSFSEHPPVAVLNHGGSVGGAVYAP